MNIGSKFASIYLTLMLYAISNLHIYPQSVTFEHLTVEDGLAHNSGLCFVQDNNGFLWIGTQNGLSRYDGYNFINYTHQPGDSTLRPSPNPIR